MTKQILLLSVLTLSYTSLSKCGVINLAPIVQTINELLAKPEVITRIGRQFSILYTPQLENQASACCKWLLANPTKMEASPQFKNKDPNVVFVAQRYYKDHEHYENRLLKVGETENGIHSRNYSSFEEVKAAACQNLPHEDSWLIQAIREAGVKGIGGDVKDNEDYFLVVFALHVRMHVKQYPGILDQDQVPPLDLNDGPEPSDSVDEAGFEPVQENNVVKGISLNSKEPHN